MSKPSKTGNAISQYGPKIAPVITSRLPIFAPSLKRVDVTYWESSTAWGKVTVNGKLTQIHRGIIDAIFAFAIDSRQLSTGALELLVDPYKITKATGSDRHRFWIIGKLRDMQQASVTIEAKGLLHGGAIVAEWREANRKVPLPGGVLNGERPLLAVTITAVWMRIYNWSVAVRYRNLMPAIEALHSGAGRALARFCITHNQVSLPLQEALSIIRAIRPNMTDRAIRKVRAEVRADSEGLTTLGIKILNEMVIYHKHPEVSFSSVKSQQNAEPISTERESISTAMEPISTGS